jgi:hypothetical protein
MARHLVSARLAEYEEAVADLPVEQQSASIAQAMRIRQPWINSTGLAL